MLSNKTNNIIDIRQKGEVMTTSKGKLSKQATTTGDDPAGLCNWNHIFIVNGVKKLRLVHACQCVQSKTSIGIVCIQ